MGEFFIENKLLITYAIEFLAAVAGSCYLRKTGEEKYRVFVAYLWLTVGVEVFGGYPYLMQYNYDYPWFIALKNSVFCTNIWLYNIYVYLGLGLISIFFRQLMVRPVYKRLVTLIFLAYSGFSVFYYLSTDAFFKNSIPHQINMATAIIVLYVFLYFLQMIKSDELLRFHKMPSFYISIALLLWYICVIPLFTFNKYFTLLNPDFVRLRHLLLLVLNLCTYSCIIFGFIYPLFKKQP